MKFVDLDCPKCGAKLHVDKSKARGICDYCGHEFLLDAEKDDGGVSTNISINVSVGHGNANVSCHHHHGLGGRTTMPMSRDQLLRKLADAQEQIKGADKLLRRYEEKQRQYERLPQPVQASRWLTIGGGIVLGVIMVPIVAMIGVLLVDGRKGFPNTSGECVALIIGGIFVLSQPVLVPFITHKISTFMYDYKKRKINRLAQECAELEAQYYRSMEKCFGFLPEEYWHSHAIESFYQYVKNHRADTLDEAIELYEKEKAG